MRTVIYALEFLVEIPDDVELCNQDTEDDSSICDGSCGSECERWIFDKVKAWEKSYAEGCPILGVEFCSSSIMRYQE